MMNKISNDRLIGEIVTEDFRTAGIFREAGIDFCCGGNKTLSQACFEKNLDQEMLKARLEETIASPQETGNSYNEWPVGFLADYIVNVHHTYIRKTLPELLLLSQKVINAHSSHHPELVEIGAILEQVNSELMPHLAKEEEVLFPAIKSVLESPGPGLKEKILSEISLLNEEHESAGSAMDKISVVSNHYEVPADACNTYFVYFRTLEQFEDDLHVHVHLENNILFKKTIKIL